MKISAAGFGESWVAKELGCLAVWEAELQAANEQLYTAYTSRKKELASASPDSLKTKRLEANAAYYKLRDRLNGHFEISEGAGSFIKKHP